jgi:hypothetical protein
MQAGKFRLGLSQRSEVLAVEEWLLAFSQVEGCAAVHNL